jgi:methyltransferase (TIGR00027 family)
MAKAAAKTGAGPTALIAIEQYFPEEQRVIKDNLAYYFLPLNGRLFLRSMRLAFLRNWIIRQIEKDAPGIWGGMVCRKRYIDEKLIESSNRIKAVVNLGAGFDTRPYRLTELTNLPVWELDQLENIKTKKSRLRKIFGKIPPHVKLLAIDFDRENLSSELKSNGYSAEIETFFILEAVTQYLPEKGIGTIFDFLSEASGGSRLAFTYVLKDFLDGQALYGWEKGYKKYVLSKLWTFGMNTEELPDFLRKYGWKLIEDSDYKELAEKYINPTGRIIASMPIERIVYAEKL